MGICGRPLCCHTYLSDFAPVSIKMAKEQSLSLNPTKISGICGRLMCCLQNEAEVYEELNRKLPRTGDKVTTPDGLTGEVRETSVLKQIVKVVVEVDDEKELREYSVSDLKFKPRHKKEQDEGGKKGKKNRNRDNKNQRSHEEIEEELELEELERLEQKDGKSKLDDD